MDPDAVAAFVERAREAVADAPEMEARNTQLRVVEPLLSALGWDVRSPSVEAAYSAANGTVVDYALCPGDRPGAFVTVTGCGDELTTAGRDELLAAMRGSAVDRGVYTNGKRYILLALSADAGEGSNGQATDAADDQVTDDSDGQGADDSDDVANPGAGVEQVELSLAALPEHVEALSALHRETVAALDADARREAARALVADADATASTVTDAVVDATGDALPDGTVRETVDPLARRFLDAVVDELAPNVDPDELHGSDEEDESRASTVPEDAAESTAASEENASDRTTETDDAADPAEEVDRVGEPTSDGPGRGSGTVTTLAERAAARTDDEAESEFVMRFFEDGRSVGAVGNPDPASAVAQGVQYLLEERGLGRRLRFPYAPEHDDLAFLHREPVHPDGRAMSAAVDLGGLYVSMDEDLDALQDRVATLAERSGLRVMFSGDWPDPDV